jgi:hypothetical protein
MGLFIKKEKGADESPFLYVIKTFYFLATLN